MFVSTSFSRPVALAAILVPALTLELGVARAAVVTETTLVFGEENFLSEAGVDAFVPGFNSALGTLEQVSARLTGTLRPGFSNLQTRRTSDTSPISFSPRVTFRYPTGGTQILPTQVVPITTVDGVAQAIGSPAAVDLAATFAPVLGGESPPVVFTSFDPILFYIGAVSGAPRGGIDVSDFVTLNGQLTVTYTYAPVSVPEPASMALFGAGLLGLAAVRRKRAI